jgi:hypothetical protein
MRGHFRVVWFEQWTWLVLKMRSISFLNLIRSHNSAERERALSGTLAAGAYVDKARSLMQGNHLRAVPNKLHVGYGTSA